MILGYVGELRYIFLRICRIFNVAHILDMEVRKKIPDLRDGYGTNMAISIATALRYSWPPKREDLLPMPDESWESFNDKFPAFKRNYFSGLAIIVLSFVTALSIYNN